jgi:hypothetical protein
MEYQQNTRQDPPASGIQEIVYGVSANARRQPVGEEERYVLGLLEAAPGEVYTKKDIARIMVGDGISYSRQDRKRIQNVMGAIAGNMHKLRVEYILLQSLEDKDGKKM